ncbi:AMP-binding protein [Xanthobacter agilis]|uniref:Long-chain-fatty-acid--CoA ligase n=1 Tax=Xanthobacter agilis TaxID=47492 RepID=A0ABU0LCX6_XANAG|nr:AMP-binding protein [Xanthobacter agilis]MDQ0504974.1 long-chain acyl-CoA synthetase [Xanthobacter agilis]
MAPDHVVAPGNAPWQTQFPDACDWSAPLEITTLPELLSAGVAARGAGAALDFRGTQLSYGELARDVERLASGLSQAGVGGGDNVALLLPNTPYHPLAFFALTRLAARVVHISALDARREIVHKLKVTGARRLVTTNLPGFLPRALEMLDDGVVDEVLVGDDARWGAGEAVGLPVPERAGVRDLASLFSDQPLSAPLPGVDDIAVLQFTGGTTGLPKAAMLSHGNLTAAVSMYRLWRDGGRPLVAGTEKVVAVLPLFHIYALTTVLLRHLRDGNTVLLRQRFDVETLIHDVSELKASAFSGVPTMWVALLNRPGVEGVDFSSLKSCVSGGAPLPFEVQAKIETLIGTQLNNGWGMTETGPAGSRVPWEVARRPGLIGIPLPGLAMRIVAMDEPGRVLPPGEVGEIAIRGPNVFKGYLNDEAGTAGAFHDGWFLTGDMGRMDARGLFEIVDRRKNMIISSGFNVYPAAVENAIYEHPAVEEVIVIGVSDAYRGQSAKAYVKLKAGAEPFTLDVLTHFLADRLGRHEMPRALEFREALPRSPVGKLLPKVLMAEVAEVEAAAEAAMRAGEAGAANETH